ncbi:MAG: sigma-54 dependent transcriptional regulator [Desulfobacteraceae bacterium]|nr:sigma-54 dependent transcriptional regulator [Desulfobacteraceae bacterium]
MDTATVLIVDDEMIMRESLGAWLERDGHEIHTAESGEDALKLIETHPFDIVFLDIKLEGMSGLSALRHIKEIDPDIEVVMITAYASVPSAIEAMKNGAYDYLLKPFEPDELSILIEKILEHRAQFQENLFLRHQYQEQNRFESLIGQSESMQEVFRLIRDVAPMNSTVLITGETGTGKGLAAKAIHTHSRWGDGPFVAVNCGAIPEHLMESDLFGHEKGAFTDARDTKRGRLELAHGGTLFLDEIGEISMRMQIDLLRVLEDGVFYRVGGTRSIEAQFRVIAATNRDLQAAIREGKFREDLFYRLNVITLRMPPLKERKDDIPLLAEHFRSRFVQETNKPIDRISREALDEMMLYDWPGNVRELENAIERAVVVGKERFLKPEDLPIFQAECRVAPEPLSLKEIEMNHIVQILAENDWNIAKSSKILGIDRSTLYNKIQRYQIRK